MHIVDPDTVFVQSIKAGRQVHSDEIRQLSMHPYASRLVLFLRAVLHVSAFSHTVQLEQSMHVLWMVYLHEE